MKIPTYQRSVGPQTVQVAEQKFASPVREAFGEGVAQAVQGLGAQGMKIAGALQGHVIERQKQQNDMILADADTAYLTRMHDLLRSTEMERLNVNGQSVERPVGALNRQLGMAENGTVEFQKMALKELDAMTKNGRTPEEQARIRNRLMSTFLSARDKVSSHEASQLQLNRVRALEGNQQAQMSMAQDVRSFEEFDSRLASIRENSDRLSDLKGIDPVSKSIASADIAKKFTTEVAERMVRDGVKLKAASEFVKRADLTAGDRQDILVSISDLSEKVQVKQAEAAIFDDPRTGLAMVNSGVFDLTDKQKSELSKTARDVEERQKVEQEFELKEQRFNNETKWTLDLTNKKMKKLSIPEINELINSGDMSPDFAEAYIAVMKSPKIIKAERKKNPAFVISAKNLFDKNTPDEIREERIRAMISGSKGELKESELLLLLGVSAKAKLPLKSILESTIGEGTPFDFGKDFDPVNRLRIRAEQEKVYDTVKNLLEKINEGKSPEVALQEATSEQNIATRPEMLLSPKEGQIMEDEFGNRAIVYSDGTYKEIK